MKPYGGIAAGDTASNARRVARSGPARRWRERNLSLRLALPPALLLIALSLVGSAYYVLPAAQRVRHAWHPWLRPSGYIGQTLGIVAFALFLFLWLYPLRKRVRWLAFSGPVGKWLDVHIAAGLLVPLTAAVHAGWNFHGLIGLGYAALCVVSLSGIAGRYLYVRIPRRRDGLELTRDEVTARRRELVTELSRLTRLSPLEIEATLAPAPVAAGSGFLATLRMMARDDLARRSAARRLAAQVKAAGQNDLERGALRPVLRLARREMALAQQIRLLEGTYALFRFWHAAHKPVAISAFVAVAIHVAVVIAVGATWLW